MNIKTTWARLRFALAAALFGFRMSWRNPGAEVATMTGAGLTAVKGDFYRRGYDAGRMAGHHAGHSAGVREAQRMRKKNAEDTGILAAALFTLMQDTGRESVEFNELLARYGPGAFGIEQQRIPVPAFDAGISRGRWVVRFARPTVAPALPVDIPAGTSLQDAVALVRAHSNVGPGTDPTPYSVGVGARATNDCVPHADPCTVEAASRLVGD